MFYSTFEILLSYLWLVEFHDNSSGNVMQNRMEWGKGRSLILTDSHLKILFALQLCELHCFIIRTFANQILQNHLPALYYCKERLNSPNQKFEPSLDLPRSKRSAQNLTYSTIHIARILSLCHTGLLLKQPTTQQIYRLGGSGSEYLNPTSVLNPAQSVLGAGFPTSYKN